MSAATNPFAPPKTACFSDTLSDVSAAEWDLQLGPLPAACVATDRTDNIYRDDDIAVSRTGELASLLAFVPCLGLVVAVLWLPVLSYFKHAATFNVWRHQRVRWIRAAIQWPAVLIFALGHGAMATGLWYDLRELLTFGFGVFAASLLLFHSLTHMRLNINCRLEGESTILIAGLHPGYVRRLTNAKLAAKRRSDTSACMNVDGWSP